MLDYAETLGIKKKHNNSVFLSKNAKKNTFFGHLYPVRRFSSMSPGPPPLGGVTFRTIEYCIVLQADKKIEGVRSEPHGLIC